MAPAGNSGPSRARSFGVALRTAFLAGAGAGLLCAAIRPLLAMFTKRRILVQES